MNSDEIDIENMGDYDSSSTTTEDCFECVDCGRIFINSEDIASGEHKPCFTGVDECGGQEYFYMHIGDGELGCDCCKCIKCKACVIEKYFYEELENCDNCCGDFTANLAGVIYECETCGVSDEITAFGVDKECATCENNNNSDGCGYDDYSGEYW